MAAATVEPSLVTVPRATMKRLVRDVRDVIKSTDLLKSQGVYYKHDEQNMLKGYALVIGPEDTPYFGGYYLFEFDYPTNYPFAPPKVEYCTNDGITRFNPNLYKNGKVCLSILNTWSGDTWTSCQSISTILITLCTVLNENPLVNEPGYKRSHPSVDIYTKLIRFKNFQFSMLKLLQPGYINNLTTDGEYKWDSFVPDMHEVFKKNYMKYYKIIKKELEISSDPYTVRIQYQQQSAHINYGSILNMFEEICLNMELNIIIQADGEKTETHMSN